MRDSWPEKNQEGLEKTIYMIASGTGKIRGAKGGGLQTMRQWRTVAMATGEEPLSTDTSQTGVSTRVLEIYGGPFETEEQASLMHQESTQNFGWAGPEFIEHVLKVSEKSICDKYDEMLRYVMSIAKGKSGSHVAGISAVALADAMIDTWFFDSQDAPEPKWIRKKEEGKDDEKQITINQESWNRAKRMAASILQEQIAAASGDVNENAVQFITDWVISNKAYFGEKAIGTCPRHHERIRKRGVYLPINTEPGADQGRIQSKEDAQIHGRQWTDRHGKRRIRLESSDTQ